MASSSIIDHHSTSHSDENDLEKGNTTFKVDSQDQNQMTAVGTTKGWLNTWHEKRPQWLVECAAEAIGTAIYCWCGIGATASFLVSTASNEPGFGDLFTIGWSYALGIIFGLIVAAPVSGGHLSAAMTISFALFRGFPWVKVIPYILAQILGAFLASLIVFQSYRHELGLIEIGLQRLGAGERGIFSNRGPAGVFALFPNPTQSPGILFWNEFIATIFLALVVYTVIDHSNVFVGFKTAPLFIGMAYAVCIWSFALETVALNTSRDLGGRFAAAALYGSGAFNLFKSYTAIAALTNILGTIVGAGIHTLFVADPKRGAQHVPVDEIKA